MQFSTPWLTITISDGENHEEKVKYGKWDTEAVDGDGTHKTDTLFAGLEAAAEFYDHIPEL